MAQRGGGDGGSGEAWGRRTLTSWGGPERGGGCARRWREGAVASARRSGRGKRRELGCSRGRGRGGREATHVRRTKNIDVGWTVEIEGRQNGRT